MGTRTRRGVAMSARGGAVSSARRGVARVDGDGGHGQRVQVRRRHGDGGHGQRVQVRRRHDNW